MTNIRATASLVQLCRNKSWTRDLIELYFLYASNYLSVPNLRWKKDRFTTTNISNVSFTHLDKICATASYLSLNTICFIHKMSLTSVIECKFSEHEYQSYILSDDHFFQFFSLNKSCVLFGRKSRLWSRKLYHS